MRHDWGVDTSADKAKGPDRERVVPGGERGAASPGEREGGRESGREEAPKPDLLQALGGKRGVADTGLPALLFVIVYTANGHQVEPAAWSAVGLAAVLAVVRLMQRQTIQYAFSGLIGVAIAAFVATRSGRAEDFFLPGILLNAAYASAYLVSIAIRWPLLGVLVGPVIGEGMRWRRDPRRLALYSRASWIWVGVFAVRLAVQLPLYFAGAVVALGIARTALGLPLFALAVWLSYLLLRQGEPERAQEATG